MFFKSSRFFEKSSVDDMPTILDGNRLFDVLSAPVIGNVKIIGKNNVSY